MRIYVDENAALNDEILSALSSARAVGIPVFLVTDKSFEEAVSSTKSFQFSQVIGRSCVTFKAEDIVLSQNTPLWNRDQGCDSIRRYTSEFLARCKMTEHKHELREKEALIKKYKEKIAELTEKMNNAIMILGGWK